jgi:uncharacterized membrane protein
MEILIFGCGILFLVLIFNLRHRVSKLEQYIKESLNKSAPESNYQKSASHPLATENKDTLYDVIVQKAQQAEEQANSANNIASQDIFDQVGDTTKESGVPEQDPLDKFVEWLKDDWLLKLGALFLLIGFGWLTTYAFLNNWIGPMGRIALGIVAGSLFLMFGWHRIKTYINQGGIFLILGSTTILLTIFAAREIYDFFNPTIALSVMFLSTVFVALASVKYNSQALSLGSLILAGVAPLLTNSPSPDYISLFAYLLVIILGVIWVVAITGRRALITAALLLVTFYSVPQFLFPASQNKDILLLFAFAFTAVFFLSSIQGIFKMKDEDVMPDILTASGNGLFLLAWIMNAAPDEWKSLIISAWMIVFAVGAFAMFKISQKREHFFIYAGLSIAMLATATAAELEGSALVIAYAIECGVIDLTAYLILKDIKIAERLSVLFAVPIFLSIASIASPAWAAGIIHKDFFVLLIVGLSLFGLGWLYILKVYKFMADDQQHWNKWMVIVGSLYFYIILWLSLHVVLDEDTAVMVSLVIYTIVGLFIYFYGLANKKNNPRIYGGVLLGFVIIRLLLIDVWKMELAGRIVTFFLVGALLVSTAFIGKKKNITSPNKLA